MKKICLITALLIFMATLLFKVVFAVPILLISEVTITPDVVIPGKDFSIEFLLKNNSMQKIENVVLKVKNLEGKDTLSGFSPIGTNQAYLNAIDPSSNGKIKIDMIVDSQLKTGIYNVVVDISYNERGENTIEETRLIGIVVNRPANLLITNYSYSNNKELKFTTVNASSSKIFDAIVYTYFGEVEKIKYLGLLDANDENEIIENIPEECLEDFVRIKILYKDELNKDYVVEKRIPMSEKKAGQYMQPSHKASFWHFFKRFLGLGV